MDNLMQNFPLRVNKIIDHASKYHSKRVVISRDFDGKIRNYSWQEIAQNSKRISKSLQKLGINKGDVIGVMAWNNRRHIELLYGIPGCGGINHTLNPRLFDGQLTYIINHANDKILIIDIDLVPVIEKIIDKCPNVKNIIIMADEQNMPETSLPNVLCYDNLIKENDDDFEWVNGDETEACGICYTSGTTGNPKGVVYTHRSNCLHALISGSPDMLGLSSTERIMPVVPLFHANGWSIGYTAPMMGSSMVLPGNNLTPEALYDLLEKGTTITAAVPTVWLLLLNFLEENKLSFSSLKRVVIGGSACPRAVIEKFQDKYNVKVLHAWGMTEMSPLGTVCTFKPEVKKLKKSEILDIQETTGHPPFSVDLKITDDNGNDLPWDGLSQGKLWSRGAAVVKNYLKNSKKLLDDDEWFDTGDVATIDQNGYLKITDRSKDVIKSGGEWISSIVLENAAVGHPDVAEAAAIGIEHPKWDERPILIIVTNKQKTLSKKVILEEIEKHVAKWQIPDDVIFFDEIPHTATGKISKIELRKILKEKKYVHPDLRK